MKEKARTISMIGVDSILGAFYDEKEENAVMDVEERWSYTINDIADRLYSFRDYVIVTTSQSFFVYLALPKLLMLGKTQIYLVFRSLNRNFAP
jgi:hypothetical protein